MRTMTLVLMVAVSGCVIEAGSLRVDDVPGSRPADTTDTDGGDTDTDSGDVAVDDDGSGLTVVLTDFDGGEHYVQIEPNRTTWRSVTGKGDAACSNGGTVDWGDFTAENGDGRWYLLAGGAGGGRAARLEVHTDGTFRLFAGTLGTDCPTLADTALTAHTCVGCAPSVGWDVPACDAPLYGECF